MVNSQLKGELRLFLVGLDLVLLLSVELFILSRFLFGHLVFTGRVALLPSLAHFLDDGLIGFGGAVFGLLFIESLLLPFCFLLRQVVLPELDLVLAALRAFSIDVGLPTANNLIECLVFADILDFENV